MVGGSGRDRRIGSVDGGGKLFDDGGIVVVGMLADEVDHLAIAIGRLSAVTARLVHYSEAIPAVVLGDAPVLVRQNDSGRSLGIPFALSRMMMCPTLWSSRSVAMSLRSLSLGRFGDRRLDKRGRRCSDAWWCVRASACGDWRGGGGRNRLVLDGFWQIPR